MTFKFESLFSSLDPYRVIRDLGIPIEEHAPHFRIPVPRQPDLQLQLTDRGVQPLTRHHPHLAGSLWDYLAWHFGGGVAGYRSAVEHILQRYDSAADNPANIPLLPFQEQFVEDLFRHRQQYDRLLALSFELEKRVSDASVYLWFRKQQIQYDQVAHLMYTATGAQIRHAVGVLAGERIKDKEHYLIYPFFSNPHTFAHLRVFLPQKPDDFINIPLENPRLSWFGLNSCPGEVREYRMYEDPVVLLKDYCHAARHGTFDLCYVHPEINTQGIPGTNQLPRGIFLGANHTPLSRLVQLRETVQDFYLGDQTHNQCNFGSATAISWLEYTRHLLLRELGKGELSLNRFLDTLQPDRKLLEQLLAWLKTQPQYQQPAERIQNRLTRPRVLISNQTLEISETETGYMSRRLKTGTESFSTNFTLHLRGALWFPDSEELFYHGRVRIFNQEAPLVIARGNLIKAVEVERICTAALHRTLGEKAPVPLILEPTIKPHLSTVWLTQAAQLPRETGINILGWSSDRQTFTAPTWQAKALGIQPTSHQAHPHARHLRQYYNFKEIIGQTDRDAISPLAQTYLAALIAQMTRYHLNLPSFNYRVRRSPQAFILMTALFYPLGQHAPYEFNPNRRPKPLPPEGLSGYPVYGTCPDEATLRDLREPLFILGTNGREFTETLSPRGYSQLCFLSQQVIQTVILGLLRDSGKAHGVLMNAMASNKGLVSEGIRLAELYGAPPIQLPPSVKGADVLDFPNDLDIQDKGAEVAPATPTPSSKSVSKKAIVSQ